MSLSRYTNIYCIAVLFFACLPLLLGGGCEKKKRPLVFLPGNEPEPEGPVEWRVIIDTLDGAQSGDVPITFTLYGEPDLEYRAVVDFSNSGGLDYQNATQAGGDSLDRMGASANGEEYAFVWDSGYDLDAGNHSVIIRLSIYEDTLGELQGQTNTFPVNNVAAGKKWTVMVYMAADNDLDGLALQDVDSMERTGSTENVNIVVQVDPYGTYWPHTTAKRYYITHDIWDTTINSQEISDLGEVNMGSPDTLRDFIEWGVTSYPAERYCLVLWDHGAGWHGGLYNYNPSATDTTLTFINLTDMAQGIEDGLAAAALDRFDLLYCDMCSMSAIEVCCELAPYARYFTGSAEVAWGGMMNYETLLGQLAGRALMGPRKLGEMICDSYVENCELLLPASMIFAPVGHSVTDFSKMGNLKDAFGQFVQSLGPNPVGQWMDIYQAAYAALRYQDLYGYGYYTGYIDLGDFADIFSFLASDPLTAANASALRAAVDEAVVYSRKNNLMTYTTGMSIFMPDEVNAYYEDLAEYSGLTFGVETGWSTLAPAFAAIAETYQDEVSIHDVALSSGLLDNDSQTITCTGMLDAFSPSEVGFMVTGSEFIDPPWEEVEVIFYKKQKNTILMPGGRELNIWELEDNDLSEDWDGTALLLSNGSNTVNMGLDEYEDPDTGATLYTGSADVYFANGGYLDRADITFDGSTSQIVECLYFDWDIWEYVNYNLQPGDRLEPYITIYEIGEYSWGFYSILGTSDITVGAGSITLENLPVPNGDYFVGFQATGRTGTYNFNYENLRIQR
ncbi:MAG: hypothetical protein E3J72_03795 [Planctomycetota bacterium]|nr:MAG: hypothetical protein E3J72_03795 [Planctomycetota bacterium]